MKHCLRFYHQTLFVFLLLFIHSSILYGQTTVVCSGSVGSFQSGSVSAAGIKNDGAMTLLNSTSNRGWAHFDLRSIPSGASISGVQLAFITYGSASSAALNNIYGFVGDPASIAGATLYANCSTGVTFNNTTWAANAWQFKNLNAAGIAFIQANLGTNNVNISFVRSSTNTYNIFGYDGGASVPTLTITYTNSCTGAPTPGNTISSPITTGECPGRTISLSLQNSPASNNLTFQWYKDNVIISGATNSAYNYLTTSTAATFHCTVTCTNSGLSTNSQPLTIPVNPPYLCYCTSSLGGLCNYQSLSYVGIQGTPLSNSTPVCTNTYTSFPPSGSTTAQLVKGSTYNFITSTYATNGSPSQTGFWIDYNQNGVFEASEFTRVDSNGTSGVNYIKSFTVPPTAISGLTGMRVRSDWVGNSGYNGGAACLNRLNGSTQDYVINISTPTPCSGFPTPGNTMTNKLEVCNTDSVEFYLQNVNLGSGISYQWYKDSVAIPGATNSKYKNIFTNSANIYCAVSCGANTTNSNPVNIQVAFYNCYCSSMADTDIDEDITKFTIDGVSTNPLYADANACINPAPGSGSVLKRYSNFKPLGALNFITKGVTSNFSIVQNDCDGSPYYNNGMAIWIDYNQNGSFNDAGEQVYIEQSATQGPRVVNGSFIPPLTALEGITGMRVTVVENAFGANLFPCIEDYGWGEAEDYLVDIHPPIQCTGVPNVGMTISSGTNVLSGTTVNLSLQNTLQLQGLSYQWYNSNGAISGATSFTYAPTVISTEFFYCLVSCGTNIGSSTPITINVIYSSLPSYCGPISAGACCITNVNFGTLSNASACTLNPNYYTLFTNSVTNVLPGTNYAFSLTTDVSSINSVWIDYNRNAIFETNEWVQAGLSGTSGSAIINIPSNALSGLTVMRVRSRLTGNPNASADACTTFGSGETEDYILNIGTTVNNCISANPHLYETACNQYTWTSTGQTYYASGIYFKTTQQVGNPGCFDTTFLHLTINSSTISNNITRCSSYLWPSNNITYTTSGTYTYTSTNGAGCDSLFILNLSIHQPNSASSSLTTCNFYTWNGVTYTQSGVYVRTFMNNSGCDSVHTLTLTINQGPSRTETVSAVNIYTWAMSSQTYTTSGIYTKYVSNPGFCDSVIYLNLTIYQLTLDMTVQNMVQISPTVFEYDIMLKNTGNSPIALQGYSYGSNHAAGMRGTGTITHSFISRDPALAAYPAVTPGYTASSNHFRIITANVASGNEYLLTAGSSIRIATLRSTNTINYPTDFNPNFVMQEVAASGKTQCIVNCILPANGTAYIVNGALNPSSAGTLQTLSAKVNTPCFYLNPASTFTVTLSNVNHVVCFGGSTGSALANLSGLGSAAPAGTVGTYQIDGGSWLNYSANPISLSNLIAGTHTLIVKTSYGCTATRTFNINQPTAIITSQFTATACGNYIWNGNTYTQTGSYTHTYTNASGCDSVRTLVLTIKPNPVVSATSVIKCINSSVNLIGSPPGGTFSIPSPYSGPATIYTYTYTSTNGCTVSSLPASVNVVGCNANVSLKLYYQGYYEAGGFMKPVLLNQNFSSDSLATDSITVELHNASAPYNTIASQKTMLKTNGTATAIFPYSPSLNFIGNSYYLAIKHRSGLTTWSKNPVAFTTNNIVYNFSDSVEKAYGDNQFEVEPNVFGFYMGDLDAEENIDLFDNPILEADIREFTFGYDPSDLNGDGNVDFFDFLILEGNIYNFIYSVHP